MKTRNLIYVLTLVTGLIFILHSCKETTINNDDCDQQLALKSADISSANGEGTIMWSSESYPEGIKRHFTFHANLMPDGSVHGNGVIHFIGGENDVKFDITCMTLVGIQAKLSGIVTYNSQHPEYVGKYCYFSVLDFGEESGTPVDMISPLYLNVAYPVNCAYIYINTWYTVEGGNIQVKP